MFQRIQIGLFYLLSLEVTVLPEENSNLLAFLKIVQGYGIVQTLMQLTNLDFMLCPEEFGTQQQEDTVAMNAEQMAIGGAQQKNQAMELGLD